MREKQQSEKQQSQQQQNEENNLISCNEHIDANSDIVCDICLEKLPFFENTEHKEIKASLASSDESNSANSNGGANNATSGNDSSKDILTVTGNMPKNTEAKIKEVNKTEAVNLAKKHIKDIENDAVLYAYDISLNINSNASSNETTNTNNNSNADKTTKFQPKDFKQSVNVKLSDLSLDPTKTYALLHIMDNGETEIIPAKVLNRRELEFKATSFSVYIVITVGTNSVTFDGENFKVYNTEGYEITDGDTIADGTNFNFVVVPDDGYGVTTITSSGATITTSGTAKSKGGLIASVTQNLTITVTTTVAPEITLQPLSTKVEVGETATFTVAANNANTYKWQYQTATGAGWLDCDATMSEGYNTSTLTVNTSSMSINEDLTVTNNMSGYEFRCLVSSSDMSDYLVESDVAVLSVVQGEIVAEVATIEPNYSVDGTYFETLEDAYASITGTSGTIIVEQDNVDFSTLIIASGKAITIDTNGKTVTKANTSITNSGTLKITGTGIIKTADGTEIDTSGSSDTTVGTLLADVVEIGDYVNYGIKYSNVNAGGHTSTLDGWRVIGIEENTVKLVSAGIPLTYWHPYETDGGTTSAQELTNNFLEITIATTGNRVFRNSGFDSSKSLSYTFEENEFTALNEDIPIVRAMNKEDIFVITGHTSMSTGTSMDLANAKYNNLISVGGIYWLASPSESPSSFLWRIEEDGNVDEGALNDCGVRPVVSLKSDVLAAGQDANSVWQLALPSEDTSSAINLLVANTGSLIVEKGVTLESTGIVIESTSANVTIGTKDGSVSTTTPVLQGATYAIDSELGFDFYDGILKGATATYNTATTSITKEANYGIKEGTEIIYATEYQTAILAKELTSATLNTTSYTYDGSAKKPSATVMWQSTTLTAGTDYKITYSNNINAGTATATITGIGEYVGTITLNYTITKGTANVLVSITGTTKVGETLTANAITLSDGTKLYQWWYADSADVTTGTTISGATNSTYIVTRDMANKYIGVTVNVEESTNYLACYGNASVLIQGGNYSVAGLHYETLEEAYNSITGTSGTIKVEKNNIDSSTLTIESGKTIVIDTNGLKVVKAKTAITNNGILEIIGNGIITTVRDESLEEEIEINPLASVVEIGDYVNYGVAYENVSSSDTYITDLTGWRVISIADNGTVNLISAGVPMTFTFYQEPMSGSMAVDVLTDYFLLQRSGTYGTFSQSGFDSSKTITEIFKENEFTALNGEDPIVRSIKEDEIFAITGLSEMSEGTSMDLANSKYNNLFALNQDYLIAMNYNDNLWRVKYNGEVDYIDEGENGVRLVVSLDSRVCTTGQDSTTGAWHLTLASQQEIEPITTLISNAGTLNVRNATLEADDVAIESSSANITIGTQDSSVNTTTPVIQGVTYAIDSTSGFNFYDGILKGAEVAATAPYTTASEYIATEAGYEIELGTEDIEGVTYNTAILALPPNYTDGSTTFATLKDAFDNAATGSIITVLRNVEDASEAVVAGEKSFVLDTAGYTITKTNYSITNNGTLEVTGTGKIVTGIDTSSTSTQLLANAVQVGDYVNYGVEYENVSPTGNISTLTGWRVIGIEGEMVNLVSAGVPLIYNHPGETDGGITSAEQLTNDFLDITMVTAGNRVFTYSGFENGNELKEIFKENRFTALNGDVPIVRAMKNEDILGATQYTNMSELLYTEYLADEIYDNLFDVKKEYFLASVYESFAGALYVVDGDGLVATLPEGNIGVRPVVTLKSDVLAAGKDATGAWNLTLDSEGTSESISLDTLIINNGTLTVSGSTLTSAGVAIESTTSNLTIGTQGSEVSTTSPVIQGTTYAIDSESGFNFYDGILKGADSTATAPYTTSDANITTETGYGIKLGTETIDSTEYKTAILAAYEKAGAPTIKTTPADISNWLNTNITFTLTASTTEPLGGQALQYKLGSTGTWTDYAGEVTVSANGETTIYARAVNASSPTNTSLMSAEVTKAVKIDKAAPTNVTLTTTTGSANSHTLTGKATDSVSGIVAYAFTTSASAPSNADWTPITATTNEITQTKEVTTNSEYYFWVKDQAGNTTVSSKVTVSGIVGSVTSVTISGANTVQIGNSIGLTAEVNGTAKSIVFTSMNTSVATVNSSTGAVTGVKAGTAVIKATATNYDGTTVEATHTVTVTKRTATLTVTPNEFEFTYGIDPSETISYTYTGDSGVRITAISDDESVIIASIDSTTGVFTGELVGAGEAILTFNAPETDTYTSATATVKVIVNKGTIKPTVSMSGYAYGGIKSSPSISIEAYVHGGTVTYYFNNSNSNSGGSAWENVTSSTALNAGTYYMYAVIAESDNYNSVTTDSVEFTITKAIPTLTVEPSRVSIFEGKSTTVTITYNGDGKVDSTVSNDTSIATATLATNVVTINGVKDGNTFVTVSALEGTNYNAKSTTINVEILPANYTDGTNLYGTLKDAFNNTTSGKTIKVLRNVDDASEAVVASGKSFVLDTNGYTITKTNYSITNNGTLKVTGTGEVTTGSGYSSTSGTLLAYVAEIGDYVNYGVEYENVENGVGHISTLEGWRVIGIEGETVKLVSAGVPLIYYYYGTDGGTLSAEQLTNNFLNIPIATTGNIVFKKSGFDSSKTLKEIFKENEFTALNGDTPIVRAMKNEDVLEATGLTSMSTGTTMDLANSKYNYLFAIGAKYHLASPYDSAFDKGKYLWGVYHVGNVDYFDDGYDYGVRPVVTLKSSVLTTGQDSDGVWQLTLDASTASEVSTISSAIENNGTLQTASETTGGQLLADVVAIGDYVNYGVEYENIFSGYNIDVPAISELTGWRVLGIENDGTVNLVSAGVPLSYTYNDLDINGALDDLITNFLSTEFIEFGFNDSITLTEIFKENEYTALNGGIPLVRSMKLEDILLATSLTKLELHTMELANENYENLYETGAYYWLASEYIEEGNEYEYGSLYNVYYNGWLSKDSYAGFGIRPVVTLKSNVLTTGQDATGAWNLALANSEGSDTETVRRPVSPIFSNLGTLTVENGTINQPEADSYAITNNGTLNINGGTLTSAGSTISSTTANLTIGTQGNDVSTTLPVIQGATYAIDSTSGFNFYDGILKGAGSEATVPYTTADANIIKETGYGIKLGTETIDGTEYNTAILAVYEKAGAPTIKTTPADTTNWLNTNITFTLTASTTEPMGGQALQYKLDSNGTWTDYTGEVTVSTNGETTIYARAVNTSAPTDTSLMSAEVTKAIKIDKAAPTNVTLTTTTGSANSHTLTGKATDSISGIVAYAFTTSASAPANADWTPITATTSEITQTKEVTTNSEYYFWVKDQAGNTTVSNAVTVEGIVGNVTSITISGASEVQIGNTIGLTAEVNGTAESIVFTSMDTSIATVNSSTGAVTGVKAGTVVIKATATNYDGTTVEATHTVTVTKRTATLTVTPSEIEFTYGIEPSETISYTYTGDPDATVTATSDDETVVKGAYDLTLDAIKLTVVGAGEATITYTAPETDTYTSATATVKVTVHKGTITPSINIGVYTYGGTIANPYVSGNTERGTVTYYYNTSNSNSGGTKWTANITSTTLDAGTYYMYAVVGATDNYNGATTDAVAFTISKATPTLTVSPSSVSILGGKSTTATVTYDGDGSLSVTPNDESIATASISSNTVTINGVKDGQATITVNASAGTNYNAKTATITVEVLPANYTDGTNYYDTLKDAFDNAATGSTITVLKDVEDASEAIVGNGKSFVLDTAGYTITKTNYSITNNGTLEIKGTGIVTTGNGSGSTGGTLLADAVEIGDYVNYGVEYENVSDESGNISTLTGWRVIGIKEDGTVNLISAGMPLTYYHPEESSGGTYAEAQLTNSFLDIPFTTLNNRGFIKNGFYSDKTLTEIFKENEFTLLKEGIPVVKSIGREDISGIANVGDEIHNNLYITGTNYWLAYEPASSEQELMKMLPEEFFGTWYRGSVGEENGIRPVVTLNAATYTTGQDASDAWNLALASEEDSSTSGTPIDTLITNNGTLTVSDSTLKSTGVAINSSTANLTIGTQGNDVSTTLPVIQGATYAIDSSSGFKFYDGILKGAEASATVPYTTAEENITIETGYEIELGTEDIGDTTYNTAVLAKTKLEIISHPSDVIVMVGSSPTFTVEASGEDQSVYTHKWYWNSSNDNTGGNPITSSTGGATSSGMTSPTLTLANINNSWNNYYVYCAVSNGEETVKSNAAKITVYDFSITTQPEDAFVKESYSPTFTVEISGGYSSEYTYQWYYTDVDSNESGTEVTTSTFGTTNSGTTEATLTLENIQLAWNNYYVYCVISDGLNSLRSNPAKITILDDMVINSHPSNVAVKEGESPTFTVDASDGSSSSYTYKWYWNSSNNNTGGKTITGSTSGANCSGVTSETLTLANIKTSWNNCYVFCEISNEVETLISNPAKITVYSAPKITASPVSQTIIEGKPVTFTVSASKGNPTEINYQWQVSTDDGANWTNIDGAASASYKIDATLPEMDGNQYRALVGNSAYLITDLTQAVISDVATLSVQIVNYTDETNYYLTLKEAFDNAASGSTIRVLKDITDTSEAIVESGKSFVLDTAGYTITKTNYSITNNGTLEVTGTGKIVTGIGTSSTSTQLLANAVQVGDYVNYGVEYENVADDDGYISTLTGWRVIGIDGETVKLVSAGAPLSYYHPYETNGGIVSANRLTNNFLNITIATTGDRVFRKSGFNSSKTLKEIFKENEYTALNGDIPIVRAMKIEDILGATEYTSVEELEGEYLTHSKYNNLFEIGVNCWIASSYDSDFLWMVYDFGLIDNGAVCEYSVRPVVTLKSSIYTTGQDASGAWKLTLDFTSTDSGTSLDALITNNGTLTVSNSTLKSDGVAIKSESSSATLTIGTEGGSVSTDLPVIQGDTYAIDSVAGFNFYDGILKGASEEATTPYTVATGDIVTESGYGIKLGTQEIDGATYKTAILAREITDADVSITPTSFIYDGADKKPVETVTWLGTPLTTAATLVAGTDYAVSYTGNVNVGTGTVIIRGSGDYIGEVIKEFTIDTKVLAVPTISGEYIYDGTKQTVVLDNYDSNIMSISGDTRTDAGTQLVTVSLEDTANYAWEGGSTSPVELPWTIAARDIVIKAKDQTITFGGSISTTMQDVEVTNMVDGHSISAVTLGASITNAGTGVITPSAASVIDTSIADASLADVTSNYNIKYETGVLVIDAKPLSSSDISVTLSETSYTYDGQAKTPSVTVKDKMGTVELIDGTDYTVSYANNTDASDANGSESSKPTVTITAVDGGNYSGTKSVTFTINAKALDVPTIIDEYVYDGTTQTVKLDGFYDDTMDLTGDTRMDAGTQLVTVSLEDTANYKWSDNSVTPKEISWTIAAREVTVKANDQTITFGGEISAMPDDVTLTNGVSGHKVSAVTLEADRTEVGTGVITPSNATIVVEATNTEVTSNYVIKYETGVLTIGTKDLGSTDITIELSQTSYTYDGQAKIPSVTVKDKMGTVELIDGTDYTVSYANNTDASDANGSESSKPTVTITAVDGGNYTGSKSVTFIINKAKPTLSASNASAKVGETIQVNYTYNGDSTSAIATSDNTGVATVESLDISTKTITIKGVAVGKATITINVDEGSNYLAEETTFDVTVTDASINITTNPSNVEVKPNTAVSFTAEAEGTNLSYQWYKVESASGAEIAISGATETTYSIAAADVTKDLNGNYYYCVVKNTTGEISTTRALLTVYYAPSITTQPASQTITAKEAVTFTVVATEGNPTVPNYQWQVSTDNGANWTNIDKAISESYKVSGVTYDMNGYQYRVLVGNREYPVTDLSQAVISNAATLNVNKIGLAKPTVSGDYTYDGTLQTVKLSSEYKSDLMTVDNNTRTEAGTQLVDVSLVDKLNYEWSEGNTTDDIKLSWTIAARKVVINAKDQTITFGETISTTVDDVTVTNIASGHVLSSITLEADRVDAGAGAIEIREAVIVDSSIVDITDPNVTAEEIAAANVTPNYDIEYVDGALTINAKELTAQGITPSLDTLSFEYDGTEKKPTVTIIDGINKLEENTDYTVEFSANTTVGTMATATITGTGNYTGTLTLYFEITAKELEVPTLSKEYVYDGTLQTATLSSEYKSDLMTVSNDTRTNAGTQLITVSLKDTANYTWSDGSVTAKQISWTIATREIVVKAKDQSITFGESISATVDDVTLTNGADGHSIGAVVIEASTDQAGVGEIRVEDVTIIDTAIANQSGGEITAEDIAAADVTANYTITYETGTLTIAAKALTSSDITATLSGTIFTYNGQDQEPGVAVSDNGSGIPVALIKNKDYTVIYVNNRNAGNANGGSDDGSNGGNDATRPTVIITAVENGNYSGSIERYFTIEKALPTLSASKTSVERGKTVQVTYTYDGDGTGVTATSSGDSIATVESVNAATNTISIKGVAVGTATITINKTEGSNYLAKEATFEVEVTRPAVTSKPTIVLKSAENISTNIDTFIKASDEIRIILKVEDEAYEKSTLVVGDIVFYVAGQEVSVTSKEIESITPYDGGAEVSILVSGLTNDGAISLMIPAGKFENYGGIVNDETTIDVGMIADNTVPEITVATEIIGTEITAQLKDSNSGISYFGVTYATQTVEPSAIENADTTGGETGGAAGDANYAGKGSVLNTWYKVANSAETDINATDAQDITVMFAKLNTGNYKFWAKDLAGNVSNVEFKYKEMTLVLNPSYTMDREWYEQNDEIEIELTTATSGDFDISLESSLDPDVQVTKYLVAKLTLKDSTQKVVEIPDGAKIIVDGAEVTVGSTNSGNDTDGSTGADSGTATTANGYFIVQSDLDGSAFTAINDIQIDMKNVEPANRLKVGDYTIEVEYYISEEQASQELIPQEFISIYSMNLELDKYEYYSIVASVNAQDGLTGKDLLILTQGAASSRIITLEYVGDLEEPYVTIELRKQNGVSASGVKQFEAIENTVTLERYEQLQSQVAQEITANFDASLESGEYELLFKLHDKYGTEKTTESLRFEIN